MFPDAVVTDSVFELLTRHYRKRTCQKLPTSDQDILILKTNENVIYLEFFLKKKTYADNNLSVTRSDCREILSLNAIQARKHFLIVLKVN